MARPGIVLALLLLTCWPACAAEDGLLLHWTFDEGSGATTSDLSADAGRTLKQPCHALTTSGLFQDRCPAHAHLGGGGR